MSNSTELKSDANSPAAKQTDELAFADPELLIGGLAYKWWVVVVVTFGVFTVVLDTTAVNIALAKLQAIFGTTLDGIQWVVTSYILALTVSIPFFTNMADRFGVKRIYLLSLILFTVASALCGLAWNLPSLIAGRVLQGLGGGALLPLAIAQIFTIFPHEERGRASATVGVPVLIAPALGPTLGGYLVENVSWRLIFYINIPIGMAGVLIGWLILREYRPPFARPMDWPGLILSTFAFSILVFGISKSAEDGWLSTTVVISLTIGLVGLFILTIIELNTKYPVLDFRLLKDWNYLAGNLIVWVVQIGLFGALFLLPIFLQNLRGLSAIQTGLWLLPSAIATAIILPLSGILVDRFGAKPVIIIGVAALILTTYSLSNLSLSTSFWTLQLWLLGRSVAMALIFQPSTVISLSNIPREALARATALRTITRQVVVAFGLAMLSTYVEGRLPLHFAHIAERATAASPARFFVGQLTSRFQAQGFSPPTAQGLALQQLGQQIRLHATILSYRDAFLLTTFIVATGLIIALTLKPATRPEGE